MAPYRNRGWMLVGLATLASIGGGVLVGQQASAEMAPFYANLGTTAPDDAQSNGVEIVSGDGSRTWIETTDLSRRSTAPGDAQDAAY